MTKYISSNNKTQKTSKISNEYQINQCKEIIIKYQYQYIIQCLIKQSSTAPLKIATNSCILSG